MLRPRAVNVHTSEPALAFGLAGICDFIRLSLTWRSVTTPLESNRAGHYSAVGPPPLFQRRLGHAHESFPARATIKSESAGLFCGQTTHADVLAYAR